MALVKQHYQLLVDLVDRGGRTTTRTYDLVATDTALDITAVTTDVATILTRLNGVSALVVKSYRIALLYLETSLVLPTSAEAELEQHALITAQIKGIPNKSAVLDIPGPEQLVFTAASGPGADQVNFGQQEVADYVTMFDSAGDDLAKISDGEYIDQNIVKGRKTHSHSNRG